MFVACREAQCSSDIGQTRLSRPQITKQWVSDSLSQVHDSRSTSSDFEKGAFIL